MKRGLLPLAVAGVLLTASCSLLNVSGSGESSAPVVTRTEAVRSPAPRLSEPSSATPTPSAVPASSAAASTPPPAPTAPAPSETTSAPPPPATTGAAVRPNSPQQLSLKIGQTATLTYFTVTVERFAHGQDGVSAGYKVSVCYTSPHPAANADGMTRVSTDPWSYLLRDGEGGSAQYKAVPVSTFPRDYGWTPDFRETRLKVGQCNNGWISVRHGNPDLQWGGVVYAPADFGDRVTWN